MLVDNTGLPHDLGRRESINNSYSTVGDVKGLASVKPKFHDYLNFEMNVLFWKLPLI